jgi:hypothetical protein
MRRRWGFEESSHATVERLEYGLRKKRFSEDLDGWASWGAAVLRPYMTLPGQAAVDEMGRSGCGGRQPEF